MTNIMKKTAASITAMLLLAALAFATVGCGGGSGAEGKYTAGTYTGSGKGMGSIEVTLTVDSDSITAAEVNGTGETKGIGGLEAIEDGTFVSQIMDAQSAEIDGVSGATITSDGVRSALEDALAQATGEAA